jgi:hypothetical protein
VNIMSSASTRGEENIMPEGNIMREENITVKIKATMF